MMKERLLIEHIPAVIWGQSSEKVMIAVHGNMSHKEDTVIELLAQEATSKGYQVLSFDLPEHGERQDQPDITKVETYVEELTKIMEMAQKRWEHISLFACSMGAYFSLMSYQKTSLEKVFFLSPLISMEALIEGVMQSFGISKEQLKEEQTIETPIGMKLYWDYYSYVKEHPTISCVTVKQEESKEQSKALFQWNHKTYILYGQKDEMCPQEIVEAFTKNHQCVLQIEPDTPHYFHTEGQLAVYKQWLRESIEDK